MSTPAIAFLVLSLVALIANWRKERIVDGQPVRNRSAIRAAFVFQLLATLVGAYSIYSAEGEAKRLKSTQVKYEAASAAASHLPGVMDTYFKCLRPSHSDLANFASFQQAVSSTPPALRQSLRDGEAAKLAEQRHEAHVACFSRLQSEAVTVLGESIKFGDQYPTEMVQWAKPTTELTTGQLVDLTGDGEVAQRYVRLMTEGVFRALATAYLQNLERSQ